MTTRAHAPLLAAAVAAAVAASGCGGRPAVQERTAPVSRDSLVLDVAVAMLSAQDRVDAVWPGFAPASNPFALYPYAGGALVIFPDRDLPPGAAPLTDVRTELNGRAMVQHGELPRGWMFKIDYKAGDRTMPLVGMLDTTLVRRDPRRATINYLTHEAFHGFQEKSFRPTTGAIGYTALYEPSIPVAVLSRGDFVAHAAVERRILAEALLEPARAEVIALLKSYLAVRTARGALMGEQGPESEAHLERKEGAAQYVGYAAEMAAAGLSPDTMAAAIRAELLGPVLEDSTVDFVTEYRNSHIYWSGAALGALLDRLTTSWKQRMQAGATFPQLAAEVVGSNTATPQEVAAVLARYDYATLLRRFSGPRKDYIAEFNQRPGFRLVIYGLSGSRVTTEGAPERRIDPGIRIFTPATTTSSPDTAMTYSIGQQHVMVSQNGPRSAYRWVIILDEPPMVNGGRFGERSDVVAPLQIEAVGVSIRVPRGGTVESTRDSMVVRIPW